MTTAINLSGNADIDGILWGWRWDGNAFSYGFPTSATAYGSYAAINGFEAFNAAQQTAVRDIFANVSSFTPLTFTEGSDQSPFRYAEADSINYTDDAAVAGHRGLHVPGGNNNSAEANPPELAYNGSPPFSASYAQGDSWYNHTSYNSPGKGSYAYTAGIMHETGHNLGLKHGHETQSGHGVSFPVLPEDHNSLEYSVMTYHTFVGDTVSGDNASDHPTTFMQDDIAALQYLYGANYNYNSGNTTYSWSPATGEKFIDGVGQGAPVSDLVFETVWDGGGRDTYDVSDYTTDLSIDLTPGGWSSTGDGSQLADLGVDAAGTRHYARGNIANALLFQGNNASLIENVIGGSGDDAMIGNDASNDLKGAGGDDQLFGAEGADNLQGVDGNDTLKGGGGNDTLFGLYDDDTLKGGGGADALHGGPQIDTAVYLDSDEGVIVSLSTGTGRNGTAEGDTLDGIENLDGSDYADALYGDDAANTLSGKKGVDTLRGGGLGDTLIGGDGNDRLYGEAGDDRYFVETNGDAVREVVGEGNDTVLAAAEFGLAAGAEVETLRTQSAAGTAAIELRGNEFAQALVGNAGANVLNGRGGADTLTGLGGSDTYLVDDVGDKVVEAAGGGTDTVTATVGYTLGAGQFVEALRLDASTGNAALDLTGNDKAQTLYGNGGANTLSGKDGSDILYGGGGADILVGGNGTDRLFGQSGDDRYFVETNADAVREVVGGGNDTVLAAAEFGLAPGVEVETLKTQSDAGTAAIELRGNELAQKLIGNAGANVLNGRGGADTLTGLSGNDTYLVDNLGDKVIETAGGGTGDRLFASVSYVLAAGQQVETLATTSSAGTGTINLTGNEMVQTLFGNAGVNQLDGKGGADTLYGFAGNDSYVVDNAGDKVIEAAGGGTGDRLFASVSYVLAAGQQVETLATTNSAGTGAVDLTGNETVQTLFGNAGANRLDGKASADTLAGLGGNDIYTVDNAGDRVIEAAGGGTDDRVVASLSYTLGAGQAVEVLGTTSAAGTGVINLTGNELAQAVIGNAGANRLDGKGGADTLSGLGGKDVFLFTTTLNANDRIADFSGADDTMHLSRNVFTVLPAGNLSSGAFKDLGVSGAKLDADDRIIYNRTTGVLSYDADGSVTSSTAVQFAILTNKAVLTFEDFLVV